MDIILWVDKVAEFVFVVYFTIKLKLCFLEKGRRKFLKLRWLNVKNGCHSVGFLDHNSTLKWKMWHLGEGEGHKNENNQCSMDIIFVVLKVTQSVFDVNVPLKWKYCKSQGREIENEHTYIFTMHKMYSSCKPKELRIQIPCYSKIIIRIHDCFSITLWQLFHCLLWKNWGLKVCQISLYKSTRFSKSYFSSNKKRTVYFSFLIWNEWKWKEIWCIITRRFRSRSW